MQECRPLLEAREAPEPFREQLPPRGSGSRRCVVFGANGFLGCHVVGELLSAGHTVTACDLVRDFTNLRRWRDPRLSYRTLDFMDHEATAEAVAGADWVFHLVSTTVPASSDRNMCFDVESNVCASIRLFEACVRASVNRVVFASSGGTVYGRVEQLPISEEAREQPIVSYGVGKLMIEKYSGIFQSLHGLRSVCLRISNPYGSGHQNKVQGIIPVFMRRIHSGAPIEIWGDGTVVRDYVHVSDVARAFRLAAEYDGAHRIVNIGAGVGLSINGLLDKLREVTGRSFQVHYGQSRPFDAPSVVLDVRRAREALNWTPLVGLEEGLRCTWQDILDHPVGV